MLDHHVLFILRDFEGDLWSLSRGAHVWLVDTPGNHAAARGVWDRENDGHSPLSGVTTFASSGDCLADFYQLLRTIDEHHDEYSAASQWGIITVRGVRFDQIDADRIRAALRCTRLGILPDSGGFAIIRAAQQSDATGQPQAPGG